MGRDATILLSHHPTGGYLIAHDISLIHFIISLGHENLTSHTGSLAWVQKQESRNDLEEVRKTNWGKWGGAGRGK